MDRRSVIVAVIFDRRGLGTWYWKLGMMRNEWIMGIGDRIWGIGTQHKVNDEQRTRRSGRVLRRDEWKAFDESSINLPSSLIHISI
jgi:hypothetical protein